MNQGLSDGAAVGAVQASGYLLAEYLLTDECPDLLGHRRSRGQPGVVVIETFHLDEPLGLVRRLEDAPALPGWDDGVSSAEDHEERHMQPCHRVLDLIPVSQEDWRDDSIMGACHIGKRGERGAQH